MCKFKEGMKVWCPRFGDGVVMHDAKGIMRGDKYPIRVRFELIEGDPWFTEDGKESYLHEFPSLFIGHKKDVLKELEL